MIAEMSGSGNDAKQYMYGMGILNSCTGMDIGGTSARTYYLKNGHSDVVQLANHSGTVTKNYDMDAFGVERDEDKNDTNPFRYCGDNR